MNETESNEVLLGWESEDPPGFGFAHRNRPPSENRPIRYDGDAHLITVAPTGAGKGRGVIIPNLLTYTGPVVVTDFKGELYQVTARRRREMGHKVIKMDPFNVLDGASDGLNPLDIFQLHRAEVETDAQMVAELLSTGNKGVKDPFWDLNAGGLLSGLIAHVGQSMSHDDLNLNTVRDYLQCDDPIYKLAVLLDTDGKNMSKMAYNEIASFLQNSERETRPSILSTAVSYVKPFISERVQKSLAKSSFSLQDVVEGNPLSVYLIVPPDKLYSHRGLLKLWVGTLLKAITTRRRIPKQRTLFLLDECAQMGKFPFLETLLTLGRGYGTLCWTFWQDLSQLKSRYETEWRTLLNNCGVVQMFGMNNYDMANQWSQYLELGPRELMSMERTEQVLQTQSSPGSRLARRMDYLQDEMFQGHFDANPFYTASVVEPRVLSRAG